MLYLSGIVPSLTGSNRIASLPGNATRLALIGRSIHHFVHFCLKPENELNSGLCLPQLIRLVLIFL